MTVEVVALGFLLATVAPAPTFTKDVAPIFYHHCAGCHRPNDIAPMSLLDYKSARPWAKSIREAVLTRKMPPWFADPHLGSFSNDSRLSEREIETIKAWVDDGAKEGDAQRSAAGAAFSSKAGGWASRTSSSTSARISCPARQRRLRAFHRAHQFHRRQVDSRRGDPAGQSASRASCPRQRGGRMSGKPVDFDREHDALNAVSDPRRHADAHPPGCAGGERCLRRRRAGSAVSDAAFRRARWRRFCPARRRTFFRRLGEVDSAGSEIRIRDSLRADFRPAADRPHIVGLYVAPRPPQTVLRRMDLRNFFFRIPPGEASHEVKRCYTFEKDKLLLSITPHMHYRGKDVPTSWCGPTASAKCCSSSRSTISTGSWYIAQGSCAGRKRQPLIVTAHYDNSPNNPANPDPAQAIRWGDKSEEEMMTS